MPRRASKSQDIQQALRQRLIRGRIALGLSQSEFARLAQVSRPVVSALEVGRGNPSFTVLKRLAFAVGCEVVELLTMPPRKTLARSQGTKSRTDHKGTRYSPSGRKPSLRTWLENPPPESKAAAAKKFGVDLSLLAQNLALSYEQRLRKLSDGAATLQWLRSKRAPKTSK